MTLELIGKLVKVMNEQTGTGKNGQWIKQEFVLETEDQFPKKVCFSVWGDKVNDLRKAKPGDRLKVSFNPESREYNERWYTDLRAWRIDLQGAGASSDSKDMPPVDMTFTSDGNDADGLPF